MQKTFTGVLPALLLGLILPFFLPDPRAGLVLLLVIVALNRHRRCPVRLPGRQASALALGVAVTTVCAMDWWWGQLPEVCWRSAQEVTLRVISFPRVDRLPDGTPRQWFEGELENTEPGACSVSGTLGLALYEASPQLMLGDVLQVEVLLRPPATQLSAGAMPDQARNLSRNRRANGTIRTVIQRRSAETGLDAWRARLGRGIERAIGDPRQAAILRALVVGDAAGLGVEDWQRFRTLGIAHVLVISGLHIGLVAGFAWGLSGLPRRFARIPGDCGGEQWRVAVTFLAAGAYALLAGLTVPTQRALLMLCVVLGVRALGWRVSPLRALMLAVALILLLDPPALLGSSLWMSAGATGVLLLLAERPSAQTHWLFTLLALQLRLLVCLLPLGWFWFGEASLAGILTNLTVVPVLTFWTVPLALLGAAAESLQTGLGALAWQFSALPLPPVLSAIDWLAARSDWLMLEVQVGGPLAVGLGLVVLAALLRRWWVGCVGGLLSVIALWPSGPISEFVVLDVGQGTAVLLRHGDRVLLYDSGGGVPGRFTQTEKIVLPWLRQAGITRIDTLLISHRDLDHSAGTAVLRDNLPIGRHLGYEGDPCTEGKLWQWDAEVTFRVLNGDGQDEGNSNANSCVLLIDVLDTRILLAGDIDLRRERQMVRYWRDQLRADLLLVAHHGSATSTGYSWLKWVAPRVAVLSRARANRFGHPAEVVMERLRALNIEVVDTAASGTVRWQLAPGGQLRRIPSRGAWSPWWLQLR